MPSLQGEVWNQLEAHLTRYYEAPDLLGIWIVLCTYISHFFFDNDPVWLLVIGIPRSGKTELAINPLNKLDNVHPITELTKNSFLSGFKKDYGVLPNLPKTEVNGKDLSNGVLVFGDLTSTLLNQDPNIAKYIAGQLRRIYDGYLQKETGNNKKSIVWEGKITCIGVCTPAMEKFWHLNQEMGERWLRIVWRTSDNPDGYIQKSVEQNEMKPIIRATTDQLVKQIVEEGLQSNIYANRLELLRYLDLLKARAKFVEGARVIVHRNTKGEITGTSDQQLPTMITNNLLGLIKASTLLRKSESISDIEIRMVNRIAFDTIPLKRLQMLKPFIKNRGYHFTKQELFAACNLPKSTFYQKLGDLIHLGILVDYSSTNKILNPNLTMDDLPDSEHKVSLSPSFIKLLQRVDAVGSSF